MMLVGAPLLLTSALLATAFLTSFVAIKSDKSKSSPFECGFMPMSVSGTPFSVPFFVISLIFILFDVEILLVCLYPLNYSFSFWASTYFWATLTLIFLATVYEWKSGALSWV